MEEVLDVVQAGPQAMDARRFRRRARSESESEGALVNRNRFSVLSNDSDDAPLARSIFRCSGRIFARVSSMEEPVHREFDVTLQDSDTESVGPLSPLTTSGTAFKATGFCSCGVNEFPKRSTPRSSLRQSWWTIWVAESGQSFWKVASRDW